MTSQMLAGFLLMNEVVNYGTWQMVGIILGSCLSVLGVCVIMYKKKDEVPEENEKATDENY